MCFVPRHWLPLHQWYRMVVPAPTSSADVTFFSCWKTFRIEMWQCTPASDLYFANRSQSGASLEERTWTSVIPDSTARALWMKSLSAPVWHEFFYGRRVAIQLLPSVQPFDKGTVKLHFCDLQRVCGLMQCVFQYCAFVGALYISNAPPFHDHGDEVCRCFRETNVEVHCTWPFWLIGWFMITVWPEASALY